MAQAKICGLTRSSHVLAAIEAGARFVGFVFFPKSPRSVSAEAACDLALLVPAGIAKVGLFVDPDDLLLEQTLAVVPLDIIQLHGRETVERVQQVKALTGLPVMKAIGVSGPSDLDAIWDYGLVADLLLIDAKPPANAVLPGGNGLAFDWRLLVGKKFTVPWLLAGGLTPGNVAEAVRLTGAAGVDVSSGVETAPGQKDETLIRQFIAAAAGEG